LRLKKYAFISVFELIPYMTKMRRQPHAGQAIPVCRQCKHFSGVGSPSQISHPKEILIQVGLLGIGSLILNF
jgi:hypothetical protein